MEDRMIADRRRKPPHGLKAFFRHFLPFDRHRRFDGRLCTHRRFQCDECSWPQYDDRCVPESAVQAPKVDWIAMLPLVGRVRRKGR